MALSGELKAFSARLGHTFRREDLLQRALTHPSMSSPTRPDNQRLEFLGDRVLNLIIADLLLKDDRAASEGVLAPRYNALVRKETCAEIAEEIALGDVLRLGRSEMMTGGRRKRTTLGDAMEAVIGAIYLAAGFDAAQTVVTRLWADRVARAETLAHNPKSELQEWAQARGMAPPQYLDIEQSGPAHSLTFRVAARLADGREAEASAGSKRQAQQDAADALLKAIGAKP